MPWKQIRFMSLVDRWNQTAITTSIHIDGFFCSFFINGNYWYYCKKEQYGSRSLYKLYYCGNLQQLIIQHSHAFSHNFLLLHIDDWVELVTDKFQFIPNPNSNAKIDFQKQKNNCSVLIECRMIYVPKIMKTVKTVWNGTAKMCICTRREQKHQEKTKTDN